MFANFDADLLAASEQSKATGSLTPILKKELWLKIQTRRLLEGKEELVLPPTPPVSYQITQAEKAKKARRREQNRRAAKRFRQNEKRRRHHLLTFIDDLESRNWQLESEIERLQEQKRNIQSEIAQHGHRCSSCPLSSPLCDVTQTPAASESGAALMSVCVPGPCDAQGGEKRVDVNVNHSSEASRSERKRSEDSDDTPCRFDYDVIRSGRICLLLGQVPASDGQPTIILNIPGSVVTFQEKTTEARDGFHSRQIPQSNVQGQIVTARLAFLQSEEMVRKRCPTSHESNESRRQGEPDENESLEKRSGQPGGCRRATPKTAPDFQPRGFELGKVSCRIVNGKVCLRDAAGLNQSPLPDVSESCSAEALALSVETLALPLPTDAWRQLPAPTTAAPDDDQLHKSLARPRHPSLARNKLNKKWRFTAGQGASKDQSGPLLETSSPNSDLLQQESVKGKVENSFGKKSSKSGVCKTAGAGKCKRHRVSRDFRLSNGAYAKSPARDKSSVLSGCRMKRATSSQRARAQSRLACNPSHKPPEMFAMNVPKDVQNQAEELHPVPLEMQAHVIMSRKSHTLQCLPTDTHENPETSREMSGRLGTAAELPGPPSRRPDGEDLTPTNEAQIEKERQMQNIKHDKGFQQILGSIFKTLSSAGSTLESGGIPSTHARPEARCLRSLELRVGVSGQEGSHKGRAEEDQEGGGGLSVLEQRLESLLLLYPLNDDVAQGDAAAGLGSLAALTSSNQPLVLFSGFKDLLLDSHELSGLVPPGADLPATPRADIPATPRAEIPATPRADLPATPRAEIPATPRADIPATPRADIPATPRADILADIPAIPRADIPAVIASEDHVLTPLSAETSFPGAEARSSAAQRDGSSPAGSTHHQQTCPCDVTQQTHTADPRALPSFHAGTDSSDVMKDISNTLTDSDDLVNRLLQCLPSRELSAILS